MADGPLDVIQQEGPGWRLARDPARGEFCVLIGGASWAVELTDGEWRSLVTLLAELQEQHQRLVSQLMAEEAISIELERGVWWGELEGNRDSWSLSVVLTAEQGRGAEGHWPNPAAAAMVATMRTMLDSNND